MHIRTLGKTGLKVSELCLGAMTFGRETDEADSRAMLDDFVAAGGTFIDTADVYSRGASEEIIGRWLDGRDREDVVIATKVRWGTDDPADRRPNRSGLSRKHIAAAVEASLRRLKTDYIDLYQVHMWDSRTPLEETLSALDRLVQDGKVRYVGASNYSGWQLQKSVDMAKQLGVAPYVTLQALYNLLDRELEWELVPVCLNEGLGLMPWSPLRGGWLAGKYHRGLAAPVSGTRIETAHDRGMSETWAKYANEQSWRVIDVLRQIAEATGKTQAQVALNWVLNRPGVTAPILGARNRAQLADNLGAAGWALYPDDLAALEAASATRLPYPYDHLVRS